MKEKHLKTQRSTLAKKNSCPCLFIPIFFTVSLAYPDNSFFFFYSKNGFALIQAVSKYDKSLISEYECGFLYLHKQ